MSGNQAKSRLDHLWRRGCAFLGTEFAILGGAMTWVSERRLVSAISNGNARIIATIVSNTGVQVGRSVIIHAKADDMKTQPSGDAGDRIGCGTIGIADPKLQMAH